jgi:hypothetical protein
MNVGRKTMNHQNIERDETCHFQKVMHRKNEDEMIKGSISK